MTHPPEQPQPIVILVAEDSEVDRLLLNEVFEELDFPVQLTFVGDGEDLLTYLRQGHTSRTGQLTSLPALVLMDLNMPRMKGIDALKELRSDALLCVLPVIVLSTSNNPRQIALAYENGVNAYLTKPEAFEDYVLMLRKFGDFWLQSAKLPIVLAAQS